MRGYALVLMLIIAGSIALAATEYGPDSTSIVVRNKQNFSGLEKGFSLINQDPDPAEPGGFVDVRFKVENTGGEPAADFIFEILPEYPFRLGNEQDAQAKLGTVHGRQIGEQGAIVFFRLLIDKDAVEGNNLINVRYSTDGGQSWVRPRPVAVRVQSHDAIIGIDQVTLEPELARPGATFTLSFSVVNHASSLLKNIRIVADLGSGDSERPFIPLGGSNEKVIGSLAGKESAKVTYQFAVDADAQAKAYRVPLEIRYVDRQGKNFTKLNTVGILVGEEPEVSIGIQSSEVFTAGSSGALILKAVNRGTSDIKFLNLKINEGEGFEVIGSDEVYIGELDSDDFSTAEFKVYVSASNPLSLPITYEFKDSNNNDYTQKATLTLPIYSKSQARKLGLVKSNFTIGIIIVVVIVALGYVGYRRWRKRKGA